ncbi:hypothetical protein [Absidia glauca]|uniref:Uncharacterized protein n=1 Tax=Absidia glauca TaxID=4829 RepID=A0A163LPG7_ABSGL|nr:hypothetical protein [Absidia glauca]
MTTDTGLPLAQRSFHIRKSLKDLAHRPRINHRQKHNPLTLPLPSLPPHLSAKDNYVYDILYECQRGATSDAQTRQLIKLDDDDDDSPTAESSHTGNEANFVEKLRKCRLDRERRSAFDSLLSSMSSSQLNSLLEDNQKLKSYLDTFDYEESKRIILQKLIDKNHNNDDKQPILLSSLSKVERKAIETLSFYSDIYSILRL